MQVSLLKEMVLSIIWKILHIVVEISCVFFLKPRDVTQLVECVPSTQKTWVQFLEPQLLDIVAHISARWRQENQDVNDGGHPWLHRELEANQACMRLCLKKGRGQFFA